MKARVATLRQWIAEGAPYEKHRAFNALQPNAAPDIGALVVKGLAGRGKRSVTTNYLAVTVSQS